MSNDTTDKMFSPQACPGGSKPRPQGSGLNLEVPHQGKRGFFITATDTGVGKTIIAGALAKILSQKGKTIGVFKPVATGCRKTTQGLVSEDAEFLAHCTNNELGIDIINPVKFAKPAAPFACEKAENRKVDLVKIAVAYNQLCQSSDFVIVEGIGGIRVPITEDTDVLSLAKSFGLPVIIVARPNLGTINHTLLTIDAVRVANLPLAGVIINGYDENTEDFAEKTNPAIIEELGRVKILAVVPFDKQANTEKGIIGDKVMNALSKIDWQNI
jgi:dethiobiotin synthetase